MGLKDTEKTILKKLYEIRGWRSTFAVAKLSNISWETADSYLQDLERYEFVEHRKVGNRDFWRFNYLKWKQLRREILKK